VHGERPEENVLSYKHCECGLTVDLSSAANTDHWPGFTDGRGLEILASHLIIIHHFSIINTCTSDWNAVLPCTCSRSSMPIGLNHIDSFYPSKLYGLHHSHHYCCCCYLLWVSLVYNVLCEVISCHKCDTIAHTPLMC